MKARMRRACQMGGLFLLLVVAPALSQDSGGRRRRATTQPTAEAEKPAAPGVGELAPLVKLKTLDGKQEFDLAQMRGKRPVIFFFGSYT